MVLEVITNDPCTTLFITSHKREYTRNPKKMYMVLAMFSFGFMVDSCDPCDKLSHIPQGCFTDIGVIRSEFLHRQQNNLESHQ